jgi:integrase/recombinase XerD
MEEQIHCFLEYLSKERAYAPNTIQAYRNDLTQFLNFAQVEKPYVSHWSRIDKPLLVTFLSHLAAHQYTPASISRKIAVIKTFFHFLLSQKLIVDDPTAMLLAPQVKKKPPQILSHDEIERWLGYHARERSPKGLRDFAILELLYASGMRVTEIVSLNLEDVNLHQAWVLCGRNRIDRREIPITQRAWTCSIIIYCMVEPSSCPNRINERCS